MECSLLLPVGVYAAAGELCFATLCLQLYVRLMSQSWAFAPFQSSAAALSNTLRCLLCSCPPQVVKSMGLEIAENELQDMIDEFAGGKDGIDEASFLKIMNATGDNA